MKPELVIMDMDGTIFDSEVISKATWIECGKDYGIEITDEIFNERFLGTNRNHIENQLKILFGEDFDSSGFVDYTNKKYSDKIHSIVVPTKKGLFELLAHLDNLNIKKAVATSSPREKCEFLLKSANIFDRFDFIVCGDEVAKSKPNPDIFLKAANHFNADTSKCIVFEDSRNGILAAKNANMLPVLVPDLLAPDENLISNSYLVLNSLDEAISYIDNSEEC